MANPFFYKEVLDKFEGYRALVTGVMFEKKKILMGGLDQRIKDKYKSKIIPQECFKQVTEQVKKDYEDQVIKKLDEFFTKDEMNEFSNSFMGFTHQREKLLKSYVQDRLEQEKAVLNKKKKGKNDKEIGRITRFLEIEYVDDGEIKKYKQSTPVYVTEKELLEEQKQNPESILPYDEIKNLESVKILNTKNIATITDEKGQETFRIYSRVKRSERELQKVVDTLTGIRKEWPFDFIATTEILPDEKGIYEALERITKYSTGIDNKGKNDSKLEPKYDDFKVSYKGINTCYDKKDMDNIIKEGNIIASKIKKNPKKRIKGEEKQKLLNGAWVDHGPKDITMESILLSKKFYEWYTGPIGHTTFFFNDRAEKRKENHEYNICTRITQYLENKFKEAYNSGQIKIKENFYKTNNFS